MIFVIKCQQKLLLTSAKAHFSVRCKTWVFETSADTPAKLWRACLLSPFYWKRWRSWLTWWWVRCGRYRFGSVVPQTVPIVSEASSLGRYHRSGSSHPPAFICRVEVRHGLSVVRVVVSIHHMVVVPRGCRRWVRRVITPALGRCCRERLMARTGHRRVRTGSSCGRDRAGGTVLGIFPGCPRRCGPRCTTTPGICTTTTTPSSCSCWWPEAESCGRLATVPAWCGFCSQIVVCGGVAVLVMVETACRLEGSGTCRVVVFHGAVVPGLRPVVRVSDYTSTRLDTRTLPICWG